MMRSGKVMIVGGGGREHALAWKAAQSPAVARVYVAPGNAGTATLDNVENLPIGADDIEALAAFAQQKGVQFTIVGPEAPLAAGIRDHFDSLGLACLGAHRSSAALESSKAFAKAFCARHHIPGARHEVFSEVGPARAYVKAQGTPIVIKADGLASGKGVVVAATEEEAFKAIDHILEHHAFGEAGDQIVIEEYLEGEEVSYIGLIDGCHVLPLASSQDHKAARDGDLGPNTGGMGAYSPAPILDPALCNRINEQIMQPTLRGLVEEGRAYSGFLYAGLMIDRHGQPRVLEFNVRLGDPEAQPIMMRLRSDLVALTEAALEGRLDGVQADWDRRPALGVVMAAAGYPGDPRTGDTIEGLDQPGSADGMIFHAGTRRQDGQTLTAGGRVLCACALGEDLETAQKAAYRLVKTIDWPGVHYRRDIGRRALQR